MRIVVAVDGSIASDRAYELVARLNLPEDAQIRVVAVMNEGPAVGGIDWHADLPDAKFGPDGERARLATALETAARSLSDAGRQHVDAILLRGDPAQAIIDEAVESKADLIVVGHRGRGAVASMLLGSTSTKVAEHAHCPVLVVREPKMASALLAEDGSESSGEAVEVAATWPIFDLLPITVVSVADVALPVTMEVQLGLYEQVLKSYMESVDLARAQTRTIAMLAAERLNKAGRKANVHVLEGSPATSIVEAARAHGVDLVVMGTRGHTGLARLALGGTAHSVMLHAPCSVLVVRGLPVAATEPRPVDQPAAV